MLYEFSCGEISASGTFNRGTLMSLKQFQHDHNHWKFFDLENHADYEYISRDPDLFFNKNPNHIIIDEAQISPEIFSALRVAID